MTSTAISAQGSKFFVNTADEGASAPIWTPVANVISFTGFDGTATEIDVTNLDSVAKEKRLGLIDFGSMSLDVHRNVDDPGQAALLAAQKSSAVVDCKLQYPDGTADGFEAYCKSFNAAGGVDAVLTATIGLTITGAVTPVEADTGTGS
ncbi:hypothetical protein G3N59_05400 [Paraburkholderia sp. Ac-20340]|jgi:hypothetical protein|uniref:phage tail tube protein n=1 Tax=Paraburkholderia sp. Ac-20340 TaxID=2703888 RepID=UPI0019822275|nr:phage tail tube protein [Paraburkholderia sp. Ac-20340]MBN3852811.1 hypothetical protein [Paraburkholderia sp. Ac-20340]